MMHSIDSSPMESPQMQNNLSAVVVGEPNSMEKVRDVHGQLQGLVSNLGDKLSDLISAQDREFLTVYRLHMHQVHRELEQARTEAILAEESLKDDKAVAALQAEHTWFSEESNRLGSLAADMEKDLLYLKHRKATLDGQVAQLSRQLKNMVRENKALERRLKAVEDIKQANYPFLNTRGSSPSPAFEVVHNRSNWKQKHSRNRHQQYSSEWRELEQELETLTNQRTQEELALEESIKSVADAVLERKNNAIQAARKREHIYLVTGVSGLGLSHFAELDRVDALRMFLSRPEILSQVIEKLQDDLLQP